ncbi:MAG: PP2C family protein-serine/threonine phosphatase, partial [Phycisphaerales bacterium]
GGDFFRLAVREDRRLRIVLGDVAGKGVGAGVLMSALHGLLRAELDRCENPEAIAMALGAFVDEHRHGNTFATAWIGEIDLERGEMRYVDAGHGYAAREREGAIEWLNAGGGPPYGAVPGFPYAAATADWKSGDRLLIVSDGFIEQPSASGDGDFGRQRMADWLASRDARSLDGLFAKILDFAGGDQLADDATAVIVEA